MATFYSPKIVTDGLLLAVDPANVKSYPGTGTSWVDLSGNGNGASLEGLMTYSDAPSRFETNAVAITDDSYLSTSSQITFADQSTYSFEFWVKLRSGALATYHGLMGRGATNPWLILRPANTSGTSWRIEFRDTSAVYNVTNYFTNYNIQQNWINIAVTLDSGRNMSVYANGELLQTITLPTSSLFYLSRIGAGYSSGGNYYGLQGALGLTRAYTKTLTSDEVLQNFNATRSRFGV